MNNARAAQLLIEGVPGSVDNKIAVLVNRMLLQIFAFPSLQAYLVNTAVVPVKDASGSVKVQLDFQKLPKEVLPELERLMSLDYFKKHKLVKYTKDGQARTGLEIEVSPEEIEGGNYDYAF